MINKNFRKLLLLLALTFLLIGFVSATNTNNTFTKLDSTKDENNSLHTNILTKKNVINKNIDNENVKTASKKNKTKLSLTLNQSKAILNDKVKITATLKDNKNKPLKNQNITIKIGTKTYKRLTNTKGKVELNYKIINNTVLGKKIIAKFNGNKLYLSSNATKIIQSNEEVIYKAKMIQIGKYVEKINKTLYSLENKNFKSFAEEYKYASSVLKDSINQVNKAIQESNNLAKYLTNDNRKTFLNLNKKELELTKSILTNMKQFYEDSKLAYDGKISLNTYDNRVAAYEKRMKTFVNQIGVLENQITILHHRYPFLIRGFEKYFPD